MFLSKIWFWLDGQAPVDDVEEVLNDGHLLVHHLHLAFHHLQVFFFRSANKFWAFYCQCLWVSDESRKSFPTKEIYGCISLGVIGNVKFLSTYIQTEIFQVVWVYASFMMEPSGWRVVPGITAKLFRNTEKHKYRNTKDKYDCSVWVSPLIGSNWMERADGIGILLASYSSVIIIHIWRKRIAKRKLAYY